MKASLLIFFFVSVFGHEVNAASNIEWGKIEGPLGDEFITSFEQVLRKDGEVEYLTHGDILVEPLTKNKGASRSCKHYRWKKGIVPFVIDPTLPNQARIWEVVAYFAANTSIRLIPRTDEKDYVYFKENGSADCSSFVGRKGGKQNINTPNWCGTGSMIHETMHALGFWHEQSRPDRRKWIKVKWLNIELKRWGNFMVSPFAKKYGEFDFQSIMLYPSFNSFAKDPEKPTMITRDGETWSSQRVGLSSIDVQGLEELYREEVAARE